MILHGPDNGFQGYDGHFCLCVLNRIFVKLSVAICFRSDEKNGEINAPAAFLVDSLNRVAR